MEEQYRSYALRGAELVCDKGSHVRMMNQIHDHGWGVEVKEIADQNGKLHPIMLSEDTQVGDENTSGIQQQNIPWFGVCHEGIKDSENICLKCTDSEETVSGLKCKPKIIGSWQDIKKTIQVECGGSIACPLIVNQSYLTCAYGGIITIQSSGREYDGSKDKTVDASK